MLTSQAVTRRRRHRRRLYATLALVYLGVAGAVVWILLSSGARSA